LSAELVTDRTNDLVRLGFHHLQDFLDQEGYEYILLNNTRGDIWSSQDLQILSNYIQARKADERARKADERARRADERAEKLEKSNIVCTIS
jgi:hypothetical protein